MNKNNCYHCGLPIAAGLDLRVNINAAPRNMCCIGCQAVAQAIADHDLADYYLKREALPQSAAGADFTAVPEILNGLKLYDHAGFQKSFVRELSAHEREASLSIEGITCAACIWLNEQQIAKLPGVCAVAINFATRRARVRWDEQKIQLSDILAAIVAIGYRAYPYDAAKNEAIAHQEKRIALWRLFVAGFGMMQVMMYAIPVYLAGPDGMTPDILSLMRWASFVLTLPVVLYSAAPFFRGAWRDLRFKRAGMDVPVALGVGVAFAASVWATLTASGEVYFDSVTMFVFFLLGGRYLEMLARQRAVRQNESLAKLLPALAMRVAAYPSNLAQEAVIAAELKLGEVVLVKAGEAIPADGVVLEGASCVNEALLTGESAPVHKARGATVTGGAINMDSPLFIQVEAVGEASRLSAIVRLMERAAFEKPLLVQMADRIASYFVLVLLVVAAAVAAFWWSSDPLRALWITVSVLVVACPCALSLATPIALTVASGSLARCGLLVTRSQAVESLARVTHFVFDKTGTLTTGKMHLLEVLLCSNKTQSECLALAAALEQTSEHPIGAALRIAHNEQGHSEHGHDWCVRVDQLINQAGSGISANILSMSACQTSKQNNTENNLQDRAQTLHTVHTVRIGRLDYVGELHGKALSAKAEHFAKSSDTVIALGDANGWLALLRFGDEIRPQAASLINSLKNAGLHLSLLSGDTPAAAQKIATGLNIENVKAGVSPQGKHDYVRQLQAAGAIVAMVGDGINDAPVLVQAQVSIAMGSGAPLARTQADIILLSENLTQLAQGLLLARRTLKIIRQNLLWSLAYNLLAIPLAMTGFITPWMAGIGMSGSSLLVVLNSLRLQKVS